MPLGLWTNRPAPAIQVKMKHRGILKRRLWFAVLPFLLAAAIPLTMSRTAHAECIDPPRPGVDWKRCDFSERDFSNSNLAGAAMRETRFIRSILKGVNFSGVKAHRAKFITADLTGANFDGARITEVDFTKAILVNVSFRNADLRRARLFRANLRGAVLTGAKIRGADLLKTDLSGARWVDGETICAEGSEGICR